MTPIRKGTRTHAHAGLGHWRWQRASAIALAPLVLWMLWLSQSLDVSEYSSALAWVERAGPSTALGILAPVWYLHGALGLQVIIEDYVHPPLRQVLVWLVRGAALVLTGATLWALLSIT
ncbi:MAG TPA: succinate dehydrogenase, hydrophobic membrane anchor protein [Gammaproteobacteria bacterium]|nr:succinate dehydrogenase, hydrophobic membrane anchor protein [Acidiferrobacteraceae bacterium]MDP6552352.1 succinate dehydrogenase, hydrophobic membrane anchor protein [Arenicellales bacterium]MDP6790361.1 succinate dehydrogenase, hydrophobic membrane anchor protein [Arenicellales bacterium]MDP6918165.1 succinate dehydrogenase, hydrophobic membrane anchor protein [Arenicellales bacterium]HCX87769.1 succinate dehydrogenase, hydrophobic membrane anchor protein [Gammaproteobacteria bacterium]|tara:strand:+ start:57602 stop:57958 length:357 start_codon:yes stop_codon:yes gene_type:complete